MTRRRRRSQDAAAEVPELDELSEDFLLSEEYEEEDVSDLESLEPELADSLEEPEPLELDALALDEVDELRLSVL